MEKWDSTWILPEWQLSWIDLSRDMITNPIDWTNYLLNWSNDLWWQAWINKQFNNKVIAYSYWAKIPTQSNMYIWSWDSIIETWIANDNYIGSNTKKVEWKFLTNQKIIVWFSTKVTKAIQ